MLKKFCLSFIFTLVSVMIMAGCNSREQTFEQKVHLKPGDFNMILINGVKNSSNYEKVILDKEKVIKITEKLKQIKISKASTEKINLITKDSNKNNSYVIGLTQKNNESQDLYNIFMVNDGTFLFQNSKKNKKMSYISTIKYPKLKNDIKEILNLNEKG